MARDVPPLVLANRPAGPIHQLQLVLERKSNALGTVVAFVADERNEDDPLYALGTYPKPGNVSALLRPLGNKLGRVDARNDGQEVFHSQVIPGSTLAGYLNADHWAAAVPIARSHQTIGSLFVTHNDFPREAMMEALLRFVEEDLDTAGR